MFCASSFCTSTDRILYQSHLEYVRYYARYCIFIWRAHLYRAKGVFTMTTLTASEARASLYRLIDQTAESHQPVLISGKRANAVLVSEEDWSAIQETLHLLAVPGMRESIKDAMSEPLTKSTRTLKW